MRSNLHSLGAQVNGARSGRVAKVDSARCRVPSFVHAYPQSIRCPSMEILSLFDGTTETICRLTGDTRCGSRRRQRRQPRERRIRRGKDYAKRRTERPCLKVDDAAMFVDKPLGHRQSEASAFAGTFGGKEGFKDFAANLFRNSMSGV